MLSRREALVGTTAFAGVLAAMGLSSLDNEWTVEVEPWAWSHDPPIALDGRSRESVAEIEAWLEGLHVIRVIPPAGRGILDDGDGRAPGSDDYIPRFCIFADPTDHRTEWIVRGVVSRTTGDLRTSDLWRPLLSDDDYPSLG